MRNNTRKLILIAFIAAVYTAISLVMPFLSFSSIQVRLAEGLSVMALFGVVPIFGLTLGCALTNLIGVLNGTNPLGYFDVLWGSLATLLASYLMYRFRLVKVKNLPLLSLSMPILINGLMIGLELMMVLGPSSLYGFSLYVLMISVGEGLSILLIGYPLYRYLLHSRLLEKVL
ncbi:MAG: QueT transporter family protein [Erysipelotrichaceae bacterium]